ncbi:DUF4954 family protein, partial [Brachyspira pilosicoli]|uniref:DUF4954 family protein n=1 Tax=Brachyspira pilosicoli TaxID=52584 RepID=UPI001C66B09E
NKLKVLASINRATLIDVFINGNVYINNIGRFIANYKIQNGVIIENAGAIYMEGESSFGNGVETSPIMEGDGRSVKIFYRLNSHIAYIVAMYRHKKLMRDNINKIIEDYSKSKTKKFGKIKKHAQIINARIIKNSLIDPYAKVENTDEINNTTVISTKECPSYIGTSVILKDSIVLKGAHIVDGTVIKKAFIGEGVKLGRQFSCEDSLLFANCEGEHGEMFSIFAGPYTVTHHKATLLIASHFSFFNAGSGTNQSNHMYKLGPYHHGFMERGCKTGSNSYILWPSHIGAFSTVIGSHYDNVDTSDFPFSYITEHGYHQTRLIPALNLFGVGLSRDENKWRDRDRRVGDKKDLIIFDVFSPYTVSKMIKAEEILNNIKKEIVNDGIEYIRYKNMIIKTSSLNKYSNRYSIAIDLYLHNKLLEYIKESENLNDIFNDANKFYETWVDVGGLICAKEKLDDVILNIENNNINNVQNLVQSFEKLYNDYSIDEKSWVINMIKKRYNLNTINIDVILKMLKEHLSLLTTSYEIFYRDVKKEYDLAKMISCGIDDKNIMEEDFKAIRGTAKDNAFVVKYKNDVETKIEDINKLIKKLGN